MPTVRCNLEDCFYNREGYCEAEELEVNMAPGGLRVSCPPDDEEDEEDEAGDTP